MGRRRSIFTDTPAERPGGDTTLFARNRIAQEHAAQRSAFLRWASAITWPSPVSADDDPEVPPPDTGTSAAPAVGDDPDESSEAATTPAPSLDDRVARSTAAPSEATGSEDSAPRPQSRRRRGQAHLGAALGTVAGAAAAPARRSSLRPVKAVCLAVGTAATLGGSVALAAPHLFSSSDDARPSAPSDRAASPPSTVPDTTSTRVLPEPSPTTTVAASTVPVSSTSPPTTPPPAPAPPTTAAPAPPPTVLTGFQAYMQHLAGDYVILDEDDCYWVWWAADLLGMEDRPPPPEWVMTDINEDGLPCGFPRSWS